MHPVSPPHARFDIFSLDLISQPTKNIGPLPSTSPNILECLDPQHFTLNMVNYIQLETSPETHVPIDEDPLENTLDG
jgi:hypothetical protein